MQFICDNFFTRHLVHWKLKNKKKLDLFLILHKLHNFQLIVNKQLIFCLLN